MLGERAPPRVGMLLDRASPGTDALYVLGVLAGHSREALAVDFLALDARDGSLGRLRSTMLPRAPVPSAAREQRTAQMERGPGEWGLSDVLRMGSVHWSFPVLPPLPDHEGPMASAERELLAQANRVWKEVEDALSDVSNTTARPPGPVRLAHVGEGVGTGRVWAFLALAASHGGVEVDLPGGGLLRVDEIRPGQYVPGQAGAGTPLFTPLTLTLSAVGAGLALWVTLRRPHRRRRPTERRPLPS